MTTKKEIRDQRFAQEYVIDLNGEKAATRAGFSAKTAAQAASRLLKNVKVQARIAELTKAKAEKLDLTVDRVLRELMLMGFANMQDYIGVQQNGTAYVDLSKLTREQASAIQEISTDEYTVGETEEEEARVVTKVKFRLADKRGSLELLGKYLKLFTDRTEVTGPGGEKLEILVRNVGRVHTSESA